MGDIRTSFIPPVLTLTDEDGDEYELPTTIEKCPVCRGKGTHVNPAIDENGLGPDEIPEGYFEGRFDVECYGCGGIGEIDVVDRTRCTPDMIAALDAAEEEAEYYAAMCAAERRAGC